MPEGGTLTVEGREDGAWYSIKFRDTGRGMSDEELARVFTPFSTAFDGGTGLGMAIVRRIVEDHGGAIDVESRPGEGTTVTILLPRERQRPPDLGADRSPSGGRPVTAGGPRLLIVDDEKSLRDMLAVSLPQAGIRGPDRRQLHRGRRRRGPLEPGRHPLRHQDAGRQRPRPAAARPRREAPDAGHHDHRAHLDRGRRRGDEARRRRLHLQAVQQRRARPRRPAGARREAAPGREPLPAPGARQQVHLRQHHRQAAAGCRRSSGRSSGSARSRRRSC